MAVSYAPRVKETTITVGTLPYNFTITALPGGYQTFFDAIPDGNIVAYCCTMGGQWEIGYGQFNHGETPDVQSLGRNVKYSSNSNAAVNWAEGEKTVFVIEPFDLFGIINHGNPFSSTISFSSNTGVNSVVIGFLNQNHADESFIIGNSNYANEANITTKTANYIVGNNNVLIENNAVAIGFGCGVNKDEVIALSTGSSDYGTSQVALSTPYLNTTDGIETLFSGNGASFILVPASLIDPSTVFFTARIVARQTGGTAGTVGDSKAWELKFVLSYASATLTQIGSTTKTVIAASAGTETWDVGIDLTGQGSLTATGQTDKTINFVAYLNAVECGCGIIGGW